MKAFGSNGHHFRLLFVIIFLSLAAACNETKRGEQDFVGEEEDKNFAVDATYSNLAEIRMGEMAQTKAVSESVKQFGETMVREHSTALEQLRKIADEQGIDLPDTVKKQDKQIEEEISGLEGAAFDSAYMLHQVEAHQKAQQLFERGANNDRNPDLKDYAISTLEHINMHLKMAKEVKEELDSSEGNRSGIARDSIDNQP